LKRVILQLPQSVALVTSQPTAMRKRQNVTSPTPSCQIAADIDMP
jgi:hypothetical protein